MKRFRWVVLGLAVLLVALIALSSVVRVSGGPTPTGQAISQSKLLLQMCEYYRDHSANPQRGKFPTTLAELAKPPFDGAQFLTKGERDLIDPWGNPYRYAVIPNTKGEPEVYVWGERTKNGKLTLHGAKRRADGEIELFGRPEE